MVIRTVVVKRCLFITVSERSCHSYPCQNGGSCIDNDDDEDDGDGYHCFCYGGYLGEQCETGKHTMLCYGKILLVALVPLSLALFSDKKYMYMCKIQQSGFKTVSTFILLARNTIQGF